MAFLTAAGVVSGCVPHTRLAPLTTTFSVIVSVALSALEFWAVVAHSSELSPAVNVPVTVNTVLTNPDGFTRTSTAAELVVGSSTSYSSTFLISPFRRSNSGLYDCRATVSLASNAYISDSSTETHTVRVTTGEMFTILVS